MEQISLVDGKLPKKFSEIYIENTKYLDNYPKLLEKNIDEIKKIRIERSIELDRKICENYWKPLLELPIKKTGHFVFDRDMVEIGSKDELTEKEHENLEAALRSLMPWRKGPFEYFGTHIDAEWRSDWKWNRIKDHIPDLEGKKVADVGCNNLYYMYRLLEYNPKLVVGMEPMARYFFHHYLNQRFLHLPNVQLELFGVEELGLFEKFFDLVFHMGIVYHRRDPIGSIKNAALALKSGGTIILESLGIPGEDAVCLIPEQRYMKALGYWFLPTRKALENMLARTGFTNIETFDISRTMPGENGEQRKTEWAIFESLEDYLDPNDNSRTIEGYPAPIRFCIKATKK